MFALRFCDPDAEEGPSDGGGGGGGGGRMYFLATARERALLERARGALVDDGPSVDDATRALLRRVAAEPRLNVRARARARASSLVSPSRDAPTLRC